MHAHPLFTIRQGATWEPASSLPASPALGWPARCSSLGAWSRPSGRTRYVWDQEAQRWMDWCGSTFLSKARMRHLHRTSYLSHSRHPGGDAERSCGRCDGPQGLCAVLCQRYARLLLQGLPGSAIGLREEDGAQHDKAADLPLAKLVLRNGCY